MGTFLEELKLQRWDDHRYYHHSTVNQALHLVSAASFVCAYLMIFKDPAAASLIGWLVAMTSRQAGHLFFEPKGYDSVNQATHEYKEEIKVGYNLRRKVVLLAIWALSPLILVANPTLFGTLAPPENLAGFVRNIGWLWLVLAIAGLLSRALHLFVIRAPQTGIVWATKILTDPFHDIKLYYRAPLLLLLGKRYESTIGNAGRR